MISCVIQIRSVLVNSSKYLLNEELSADGRSCSLLPPNRRAGQGIPVRGNTPFGQILNNLFASSNPDQGAGILDQLLSAVRPGTGLGFATGVGSVAAGVAILTGVQARLAAILVSTMLASFALLVHQPTLLADHSIHMNWTESAVNLAVIGAAWVVAHSLARPRR